MGSAFEFETTPFFFLRHGETDDNRDQRIMGQLDKPLNENGIAQANAAAQTLASLGIAMIYSSSLGRTLMTARIISEVIGVEVQPMAGLMERHYGLYQGQDRTKRAAGIVPKPDGVESWQAFSRRTRAAMKSIQGPSPLLVIGHSGTFRAVIGDQKARVSNAIPLQLVPPTTENTGWSILPVGV